MDVLREIKHIFMALWWLSKYLQFINHKAPTSSELRIIQAKCVYCYF